MSIPGSASPLFFQTAAGAGAGFSLQKSVRFDSSASSNLSRTPSSAGTSRKIWTLSFWVKRCKLGVKQRIFSAGTSGSAGSMIKFDASDRLEIWNYTGSYQTRKITNEVYRDASAWYHITISQNSDTHFKLYVNNVEQTFSTSTGPDTSDWYFNATTIHRIGTASYSASASPGDFYLAEMNWIDGQALAATDFGGYDDNGVWQAAEYSGTYGTNGFHLFDFANESGIGNDSSGNDNDFSVNNLTNETALSLPGVDFDGTNDHVESADHADYSLGTNDFTMECYIYPREFDDYKALMMKYTGTRSTSSWWWSLNSSGHILFYLYYGSSEMGIITSGTGMTLNKWNHVACVRDGSTARVYINGVQVGTGNISTNSVNDSSTAVRIGEDSQGVYDLNAIMSNVRLINGTCLYPSGTTFTVPTTPLTNVTNTKLLCCQSNSSATAATVSPNTLSTSGDPYAVQISDSKASQDVLFDVPTNGNQSDTGAGGEVSGNYATWNPLFGENNSLSNGNLNAQAPSSGYAIIASTMAMTSGKYYMEYHYTSNANSDGDGGNYITFGVSQTNRDGEEGSGVSDTAEDFGFKCHSNGFNSQTGGQNQHNYSSSVSTGDILSLAFDADAGKLWVAKNGTWMTNASGTGDPANGNNPDFSSLTYSGGYFFMAGPYNSDSLSAELEANFGARPWTYAAPSGFKALCTTNSPTATVSDGSTGFDVVTYTGNDSGITFSGLNMSPDLVWLKTRSGHSGKNHTLFDSVRGVYKFLMSNSTAVENDDYTTNLTAFNSDGFTLGTEPDVNGGTSRTYVGWLWDAGSSTVSNTDGSITSNVRVNQSAGFSIATYTGNGTTNSTVGHGLNAAPSFVIIKNRSNAYNWAVLHTSVGTTGTTLDGSAEYYMLQLDSTAARNNFTNDNIWNPTNSTFKINGEGTGNWVNANGDNYVAYCWAPVAGYSAFGSYEGNGNADGPFVFLGFKPALVIIKIYNGTTSNWVMLDSTRDPDNVVQNNLYADTADAENQFDWADFLSNGFKPRVTYSQVNGSGYDYIYMAWAENPFSSNGGLAR